MSIYQDLNNIQMDVSDYEEEPLAAFEQKKWEKRVLRKLHKCKNNTSKRWLGLVDTFNFEEAIDHPWVFDVTISTSQLAKETTTFHVDKTVALTNGQKVKLEKVIVTPISTLVYYDLTEASEATYFKIVSASGKEWSFKEASNSNTTGDQSYSRYAPIDIKNETYSLIPYNEHNEKIGPSIPIK